MAVIATLALALGGAGGLFSLLDAVVLRPLPVREPSRLVAIFPANGEALFGISMPTLAAFAESQHLLASICGAAQRGALNVEAKGATLLRAAESVTGECTRVLGLDAAVGRLIGADDSPVEGPSGSVVVLGHRVWRDSFGAARDVIGRTLRVEGQALTVISVLPETYRGLNADEAPDIVVPLETMWRLRGGRVLALHMIGRLLDGVTQDQAAAYFRTVWPAVWRATNPQVAPGAASRAGLAEHLRVDDLSHGVSTLRYRYAQPLRAVVMLSGLLVLLACVNVGALCLARTVAREQQLAVHMTLGASRGRIAVGVCIECVTLALAAAAVAAPVAWWTSRGVALTIWTGPRPLTMVVTPSAATLVVLAALAFPLGSSPACRPCSPSGCVNGDCPHRTCAGSLAPRFDGATV